MFRHSYLDDVVKAPAAPDKEPGADSIRNKDGILVDEFGLPKIPSSVKTSWANQYNILLCIFPKEIFLFYIITVLFNSILFNRMQWIKYTAS